MCITDSCSLKESERTEISTRFFCRLVPALLSSNVTRWYISAEVLYHATFQNSASFQFRWNNRIVFTCTLQQSFQRTMRMFRIIHDTWLVFLTFNCLYQATEISIKIFIVDFQYGGMMALAGLTKWNSVS